MTKPARDARGRFIKTVKLAPAVAAEPIGVLWMPDARWVAPSAADRATARSVVAAADAHKVALLKQEAAIREAAELPVRLAKEAAEHVYRAGCEAAEDRARRRMDRAGKLLILAIFILPALFMLLRPSHVQTAYADISPPPVIVDALTGAAPADAGVVFPLGGQHHGIRRSASVSHQSRSSGHAADRH